MPWTDYGKQQIFAVGVGAIDQPILYVALFSTSADPATPPVELTLAGYGRQRVDFDMASTDNASSHADVAFGPLAAGAYTGVQILDDPVDDTPWFWDDETGPQTITDGEVVTFVAGQFLVIRTA